MNVLYLNKKFYKKNFIQTLYSHELSKNKFNMSMQFSQSRKNSSINQNVEVTKIFPTQLRFFLRYAKNFPLFVAPPNLCLKPKFTKTVYTEKLMSVKILRNHIPINV